MGAGSLLIPNQPEKMLERERRERERKRKRNDIYPHANSKRRRAE
jgi:hypothetical protein